MIPHPQLSVKEVIQENRSSLLAIHQPAIELPKYHPLGADTEGELVGSIVLNRKTRLLTTPSQPVSEILESETSLRLNWH